MVNTQAGRLPVVDPQFIPFIHEIWELVKAAGAVICVVLAYFLKIEREQRNAEIKRHREVEQENAAEYKRTLQEHHKENAAVTDRAVNAIYQNTLVIQGFRETLQSGRPSL